MRSAAAAADAGGDRDGRDGLEEPAADEHATERQPLAGVRSV
jgi:hypothetical protein